jgi:hypothetical protein
MDLEAEAKYPEMFEQCFEVWCPQGWIPMVEELCDKIYEIDKQVKIQQIKEKFGGLRFYYQGSLYDEGAEVDALVTEAENNSYKTCQECGIMDNGKVVTGGRGWIVTLCESCRENKNGNSK